MHTDIVKYIEKEYNKRINGYESVKQCLKDIKAELESMLTRSLDRLPLIIPMFVYINNDGEMVGEVEEVTDAVDATDTAD